MVEAGGIGEGGWATAGEDMDSAMADCGGSGTGGGVAAEAVAAAENGGGGNLPPPLRIPPPSVLREGRWFRWRRPPPPPARGRPAATAAAAVGDSEGDQGNECWGEGLATTVMTVTTATSDKDDYGIRLILPCSCSVKNLENAVNGHLHCERPANGQPRDVEKQDW